MSGEINVIQRTQQIIVEPVSSSVAVINAGPPGPSGSGGGPVGPPGPPGPPGAPSISVIKYGFMTVSGSGFSGTEKFAGLATTAFTLPAMQPENFVELSVYCPRFIMSASSAGWPISQGTYELRVKNATAANKTCLFIQGVISGGGSADPNGLPSLYGKAVFDPARAASYFPPNSVLNVMGVLGGKTSKQGYVKIEADTGVVRPEIVVRLI